MKAYIFSLEAGIIDLAEGCISFKTPEGFPLSLRMAHIEHHYVILRMRGNIPPMVEAILHERSDYMRKLSCRVDPGIISGEER